MAQKATDFSSLARTRWVDRVLKSSSTKSFEYRNSLCETPLHYLTPITREYAYILLQQCGKSQDLAFGRRIQLLMLHSGLDSIAALCDHVIRLFAHHRQLPEGHQTFNKILDPSAFSWAAILMANCKAETALELYDRMNISGIKNNSHVYVALLQACTMQRSLLHGRALHDYIIGSGLQFDVFVGSALVDMYAKCGSLSEAIRVFSNSSNQDVVLWNTLISGYAHHGEHENALEHLRKMQQAGITPNAVSWNAILAGYACSGEDILAMHFFEQMQQKGIEPNMVSWGSIIAGLAEHKKGHLALACFEKMLQEGLKPNEVIFLSVLKACAETKTIEQGRHIHSIIMENGLQLDVFLRSTLVDMYSKCGSLGDACKIFNMISDRDVVLWNSMIAGYGYHGEALFALDCFDNMQHEGISPDVVSFTNILTACSHAGLVADGRRCFTLMKDYYRIRPESSHCTCMVNLLGGAGYLMDAENLLHATVQTDAASWISLLNACRKHGDLELAKRCFDQIISLDTNCSTAYVLMSNMLADACKQKHSCDNEQGLIPYPERWTRSQKFYQK